MGADVAAELLLVAMVSQRDAAIRAFGHEAAERALQRGGIAAPVQEENDLLLPLHPPGNGLFELRREDGHHFARAHGLAHIHDAHDGHLLVVGPLGQLEQRVFALAAVVIAFQRGRGGAEHDHGAFHLAAHNGDVARVVAGRLLLLVGVLVFLVHNDQAERLDRRKDGGARADGDPRAALANLVPLVVPLAGGQMAVQHCHQRLQRAGTEPRLESLDGLRRERDLRDEDNCALALFQRMGDGLQINLRLAAAGNAVEEKGRGARGGR